MYVSNIFIKYKEMTDIHMVCVICSLMRNTTKAMAKCSVVTVLGEFWTMEIKILVSEENNLKKNC